MNVPKAIYNAKYKVQANKGNLIKAMKNGDTREAIRLVEENKKLIEEIKFRYGIIIE